MPATLDFPVARTAGVGAGRSLPAAFIHPVLDGRPTHYYEWQPAGRLALAGGGAAMHAGRGLASDLFYGFDRERFYLRVDFTAGAPPGPGHGLRLDWVDPVPARVEVASLGGGEQPVTGVEGAVCRVGSVVELALPRSALGLGPGASMEVLVRLLEEGRPVETLPADDVLRDVVPDDSFDSPAWAP